MASETVELRGHIIDSLILPKVLDEILRAGGQFKLREIRIGEKRADQSFAKIEVSCGTADELDNLILRLRQHGAETQKRKNVELAPAPADGVFPDDFYVTTSQQTFVRVQGKELPVQPTMMDCAIAVDDSRGDARAIKFAEVTKGDQIVIGHRGIRVQPVERVTSHTDPFQFASAYIPADQPKVAVIRAIAHQLEHERTSRGKVLVVAGPVLLHTDAAEHLEQLIGWGYIDLIFGGNALAVHDVENALFGTSLGINLDHGRLAEKGHENQLRAINVIRRAGSIARAVETGVLKRGILHRCVASKVEVLLAGSIRDDGPMPGVITDSMEAQRLMREKVSGVTLALLMGSMLHSIAVRNLLPASVKTVCVDINPFAIQKLSDPASLQTIGLVTDVEAFLRELVNCLKEIRKNAKKGAAA